MTDTPNPTGTTETTGIDPASFQVDFWLFVLMLALAIIGVGVTQLAASGGWRYWIGLAVVYAGISVVRTWQLAKRAGKPVWRMVRSQVLHWAATLVAIKIVLLFESSHITDRGPASDFSLLILALSCFLAGVHFNPMFMLLGAILAIIAVALGYLDQLSIFVLIVPLAALAVWIAFKRKFSAGS
jgi:hypothetical protein